MLSPRRAREDQEQRVSGTSSHMRAASYGPRAGTTSGWNEGSILGDKEELNGRRGRGKPLLEDVSVTLLHPLIMAHLALKGAFIQPQ